MVQPAATDTAPPKPGRLLRRLLDVPARRLHLERLLRAGPYVALSLALLMMWGVVIWYSVVYPQRLLEDQRRELAASARTAATQVEGVLRDAESNLRTMDLWLLTRQPREALRDAPLVQLAETLRGSSREMVDVLIGSADGRFYRLPALTGEPFATLSATQLRQLMALPAGASGLAVGEPLRLREGGTLKLPLLLRMSAPSGELSLLLALVDHQRLSQLLQPYARGEAGVVALLRSDGLGLLRQPEFKGFIGQNFFQTQPRSMGLLQAERGNFLARGGATDGHARQVCFETLADFRLKVLLGQGEGTALGEHSAQRAALIIASLAITVLAFLITLALNRLQREARECDAMLAATSDASPLGLFRCDAQGALTYANDTYLAMHGFGVPLQPWAWLEVLPPEVRERARDQWRARVAMGEAINVVRKVRLPDGRERRFAVRTAPLRLRGRVVGAVGTVDDVTERVAQQEAQLTLTAIFEQTPDYICQFDAEGRLIYLNPAGRRRMGLALDAPLPERHYCSFLPAAQREAPDFFSALPEEALIQGHWQGLTSVVDVQGQTVPVASTVLVHRDARRQVRTVSVLLRDISEQVQAQQERERSEAMLKGVAEQAPIMIAVLDEQQRGLFFNHAYEQFFQGRREDWIGRRAEDILEAEDYAQNRSLFEAALAGQSVSREFSYDTPEFLVLETRFAPLRLEGGHIGGVVWTARDITREKQEQARLLDASQTDPLTQLLNRAGFDQRAEEALALARQHDHLLCLLYLDLDRFKPVNDQYGHPVGDALLRAVAGRLRHALRPQDLAARLGGDEFAVLLPALPAAGDAEVVAAKLLRAISTPFMIEKHQISVGVSVGFCVAAGGSAELERMVSEADARLYEAKRAGRGVFRGGVCE